MGWTTLDYTTTIGTASGLCATLFVGLNHYMAHKKAKTEDRRRHDDSMVALDTRRLQFVDSSLVQLFQTIKTEVDECKRDRDELREEVTQVRRELDQLKTLLLRVRLRDEIMQGIIVNGGLTMPKLPEVSWPA